MLTPRDILIGVVLPFLLCGAILKLAHFVGLGRWAGPVAVGVAFSAAFGGIEGAAHLFPPPSAIPWLFYLGPLFMLAGLLDAARLPTKLRPLVIFFFTLVGGGLVLRFNFTNHTWDAVHGVGWLSLIAGTATIWWVCFESSAGERGIIMPLGAMFITGIAGLVVMLVADQTVGQALGAVAISLGAAAAVVAWLKDLPLTRGTTMVFSGVGICALAAAYFLSDVPILDLSLVGIAPVLLALGAYLPLTKLRPWLRVSIRLAIVLIPLGIALALAVRQFQHEAAEKSSDPYSAAPPQLTQPLFT